MDFLCDVSYHTFFCYVFPENIIYAVDYRSIVGFVRVRLVCQVNIVFNIFLECYVVTYIFFVTYYPGSRVLYVTVLCLYFVFTLRRATFDITGNTHSLFLK